MFNSSATTVTRIIFQQAIAKLFVEAGVKLPDICQVDNELEEAKPAISKAKDIVNYSDESKVVALRSLFDYVRFSSPQQRDCYWKPFYISNKTPIIPYPQLEKPDSKIITDYLRQSCEEIAVKLNRKENWNNLALLSLIVEKYGSFIGLGSENIAFVDSIRSTTAVAAALAENPEATELSLIVGDLSGVQSFIYTISSAGALKSLRARSLYLELVTEEVVQQLLYKLQLPRTNIIFAGASKLYILAANSKKTDDAVKGVSNEINRWLRKDFQGKVFLSLDNRNFKLEDVSNNQFSQEWSNANKNVAKLKSQKFRHQLSSLLTPQSAYEPCKVCHRDDVETLKILGDSEVEACGICRRLYRLGGQLRDVKAIVRSHNRDLSQKYLQFKLGSEEIYYHLFDNIDKAKEKTQNEKLFLINNWNINDYTDLDVTLLLIGNYSQKSKDDPKAFATAEELAEASQGIKRVGYLRMDVDNLGKIFAEGLGDNQTLPQIAGLSRQMTYFFKVYLNNLAADRNKLPQDDKCIKVDSSDNKQRDNLLFIYAGGDDLFISGAWNEVVEFSFDVYQCFRAYTGYNPDITISAGIELAVPKFPLYQAAKRSGDAEEAAKGNGRDSLTLFGETFKWDEWLGSNKLSIETVETKDKEYWQQVTTKPKPPELLGILPIVGRLKSHEMGQDYTRNFVRNLVNISNLQRQKIKEIERRPKSKNQKLVIVYNYEDKDIKYYLHLPQIAYTLARLPRNVLDDEDFRKALKNPYNAPYYRAIATWIELLNR